ncbi:MAG: hypothetical protein J1F06_07685, partial [Prevotellaceae bacterium]|nr:hypothetical protein [Prevotellaceae bacterium]
GLRKPAGDGAKISLSKLKLSLSKFELSQTNFRLSLRKLRTPTADTGTEKALYPFTNAHEKTFFH